MASIPVKPQRPVIDWGNPITRGLIFDAPLFEGSGIVTKDAIAPQRTGAISGPTWIKNLYGKLLSFAGGVSTDKVTFANGLTSTNFRTIESIFYINALDTTARRLYNWTNSDNIQVATTATVLFAYNPNWSGTSGVFFIANPSVGTWHHSIVVYDGSLTTNVPVMYMDGIPQAVTVQTPPVGSLNAVSSQDIIIGNRSANDRPWNGYVALNRRWNRLLTQKEVLSLQSNPWQVYVKPSYFSSQIGNSLPSSTTTKHRFLYSRHNKRIILPYSYT